MAQKHYERFTPTTDAATTAAATTTAVVAAPAVIAPRIKPVWIGYPKIAFSDPAAAKVIAAAMTAKSQIDGYLEYNYGLMKHITFPHIEHLESLVRYCLSRKNRPIDNKDLEFVLSRVTRYERDGQISVKEFTNWINWIDKMREMIDNLLNMFYETTFHGEYLLNSFRMTSTDAENILKGSAAYTFVLRWSHSCNSMLSISYIKEDSTISHLLIEYTEVGWSLTEDGKKPEIYPDVKEMIEGCAVFQVFAGDFPKENNFPKEFMAPSLHKGNQMFALNKAAMAAKAAAKAADSP